MEKKVEVHRNIGRAQGNTQMVCAANVPKKYAEADIHVVQFAAHRQFPIKEGRHIRLPLVAQE